MHVKYIDISVLLCATTKYSDYKSHARRIINGGIAHGSNYILKIPQFGFTQIKQICERREKIYSDIYSTLGIKKCINKTTADFYSLFTRGSTRNHTDNKHLEDMIEKITDDMNIKYLDKLNEEQAKRLCYLIHKTIRYNKIQLSSYMKILEDEEVFFQNNNDNRDERKLRKEFEEFIDNSKYKSDIIILSKCIDDGIKSNMDFEIIIANECFLFNKNLRKINTAIKRVYKKYDKNIIIPISKVYGNKTYNKRNQNQIKLIKQI